MTNVQRRVTELTDRHPRVFDGIFAAVICFFSVGLTTQLAPVGSEQEADAFAYILLVVGSIALYWRRTRPLVVLPVVVVLTVIFWVADYAGAMDPVPILAFYSAARYGGPDRRRVWRVLGIGLLTIAVVATIGVIAPTEDLTFFHLVGVVLIHGTVTAIGEALYQRSNYVAELEHRTASLEADLQTQAVLAAVEERTRIAREMHDIIAHGMSAVVVQAQGGQRLVDSDPERARRVFETIESIGRDSSNEMRRMLGVLRDDQGQAELAPQPTLQDCDALIEDALEAGVHASLQVTGHERAAPPGVELAGYRIVQEALTNVIRHAGRPVTAQVGIDYGDESLEITIIDDGLGAAVSPATSGSEHGLLGMRERVDVYQGTFDAGPRLSGGYRVHASLPIPARVSA